MFNCGDLIVYGNNGVCCIEDITTSPSEIVDKDKYYYVLKNLSSKGVAYVPVDSNVYLRPVMSQADAKALINEIPSVSTGNFDNVSQRELQNVYRDTLLSHDSLAILSLIKHICLTAKRKQLAKKKLSSTEERFLEQALKVVVSELSVALDVDMNDMRNLIINGLQAE